jgi:transglutaminase-like putative cysteine protease
MKKSGIPVRYLFLIFLFHCQYSFSQASWDETLKNENGVVLLQRQDVDIQVDENGHLQITERIFEETKHFSENAILYSEQSIGYSETFTEIDDVEAYTLAPNQRRRMKKVEVESFVSSDARSDGIFYDDQKKISFVFPALKKGAVTHLSYTKRYKEPRLWGYFMFSSYFPVQKSVYQVTTTGDIVLNYVAYGIEDNEMKFTREQKGSKTVYTWEAEHVEKIQLSKGADGLLHTAPHLIIHVDHYTHVGEKHQILGDVGDLHAWYENFIQDMESMNEDLKMTVQKITEGKSSEIEKVEAIYNWVQQNIKYIAIEDGLGGFKPRSAETVYNRRYGDCKDMSNLLHNMLNMADIPSNLAWIGTKRIPYSHKEVPTPMADNHMICTYFNGEKYFFLDATDQYNMLGMPTTHIQGREALVHKGTNDFELINVPVVSSEENQVVDSVGVTIDENRLIGKGYISFSGYNRIPITTHLENLEEKEKKTFLTEILKKGNNKFMLKSVKMMNLVEKYRNLEIEYDFVLDDYVLSANNEIYINPHFELEMENGLIDMNSTTEDIHYQFKNIKSNIFCIEVPENYEVSYLPEDRSYLDDDFSFEIDYVVKENTVIIRQDININTIHLKTSQFDSWNKMIRGLFSAYKESIVLSKS